MVWGHLTLRVSREKSGQKRMRRAGGVGLLGNPQSRSQLRKGPCEGKERSAGGRRVTAVKAEELASAPRQSKVTGNPDKTS